ncbi:hypothetical protein [Streptomyces endophyticus]|uniref:ABC transporter permease n=1 Tax=Streptomyces endophyticus TaxID=714166 RepID=A0ABU6FBP2_9ACTN|nr:hypothetical protein [Streptomyces endophyticus]MEB8341450.1 hypothetical protein [Streptomyces endophyticus]
MENNVRPYRGTLYRFTLWVSLATAVLGFAILAGAFAAAWDGFENVREYADRNIANEDSYVAYADGGLESVRDPGAVAAPVFLLLALVVVSVLHSAYAVGSSHARRDGGSLSVGELWRRTRPRLFAAVVTNFLTGIFVAVVVFAGLFLFTLVDMHDVPGVEPTPLGETASWQYTLVGWVLPIVIWSLGPLLWFRLSGATAETVLERRNPFVAVWRSWVLTRRARLRTLRLGLLSCAAAVVAYVVVVYSAGPLNHYAGLGTLWLNNDNVWMTGVFMIIFPTAVALLLLPPLVMPLVCGGVARLHGDMRALEEAGSGDGRQPARPEGATRP